MADQTASTTAPRDGRPRWAAAGPLTVAVDLDGVTCDLVGGLRSWAIRCGMPADMLTDPDDYDFAAWGFCPTSTAAAIAAATSGGDLFATLNPMPGAIDAIRRLQVVHRVCFVTARAQQPGTAALEIAQTGRWLAAHGLLPAPVHFTADKTSVTFDVLIDDHPHNIAAARAVGRVAVVYDHPYNRDAVGHRVSTWDAIARLLLPHT